MIIAINKPKGPSSFNIVYKVRQATGIKKVGHAGTLDPLASGVLVVAIGRKSTKDIDKIVKDEKEYIAKIKLGFTSSTDDDEGAKTLISKEKPTLSQIEKSIKKFIGEIDQVPPQFSAIKINGQRAYKIARQGQEAKLVSRKVMVKDIKILKYKYPYLEISVLCGPGTYIRSIARDIGNDLGVGGHLTNLIRTRVGKWSLDDCITYAKIKSLQKMDEAIEEKVL